eukprot:SAG31_NODE_156_length_22055_cov_105.227728_1_plen_66_part_00
MPRTGTGAVQPYTDSRPSPPPRRAKPLYIVGTYVDSCTLENQFGYIYNMYMCVCAQANVPYETCM